MKIAFDGQLFIDEHKTGIAWNAHNIIRELTKYPENECIIQCFTYQCTPEQLHRLDEYRDMGCMIACSRRFKHTWYKLIYGFIPVPYRFFFRKEQDITQFFNFTIPPGVSGRKLVFIHDMAYKACPDTVDKRTRIWLELSMKQTCRRADHILTVSEFSKREIVKYMHVPEEKITVVPNAVDHTVYHNHYTKEQIREVQSRFGIEKEYFLYLGTIEPRKNLERLIGAYGKLYCDGNGDTKIPQLVLAGKKGWLCDGIYEKARRMNLGKKILFPGYINQKDSPVLMCGAKAFLFPSIYEGFGMPPLEAMACGTPVITSNAAALSEAVGPAGITVNPKSEKDICEAMRILLQDDAYRKRLQMLGLERAKSYTWAGSVEILMDVYRAIKE